MGMFDNIKCEYPLPEIPQGLIDEWDAIENIVFQTKDTPDQYMSLYKIDAEGQLWVQKKETRRVEPKDPNGESIDDRLGRMETLSTWWEKEGFTGIIAFYEGYKHPDEATFSHESDEWQRFVTGWIEYSATFLQGKLVGDISVTENTAPIKRTDEELAKKRVEWAESRKRMLDLAKKHRSENPTPEQKLIDSIYKYISAFDAEKNYLVQEIIGKIKVYRETHDIYHEKLN